MAPTAPTGVAARDRAADAPDHAPPPAVRDDDPVVVDDPPPGGGDGRDGGPGGGRRHPWLRRSLVAVLLVGALAVAYLGVTFVQVWAASRTDEAPRSDAIVVLGAAQYDGRPSPVLEARLRHALALYRRGVAPTIVVTGGRQAGDRFTEATSSYNWLRDRGVPDADILKEVKGRNTWESLAAVSRFLRPRGVDDVVLVSDSYHSERLLGVAREVGLDGHVSPATDERRSATAELKLLGRETLAVAAGRVAGYRRLTNLIGCAPAWVGSLT